MKQLLGTFLCIALLAAVGCGRHTTVTAPDGSQIHVDQGGKSVTVTTDKGTVTAGGQVDVEKTFGIPAYPGATQQTSFTGSQGDEKAAVVMLQSKDGFDKVLAFYKEKFPKANVTTVNSGATSTAVLAVEGQGKHLSVTISSTGDATNIQIATTSSPASESPAADAPAASESPSGDMPSPEASSPTDATPATPEASGAPATPEGSVTPQESPTP